MIDMQQKWRAVSFGPSSMLAEAADRRFKLDLIVNERRSFSPSLYNLAMVRNIAYRQIETTNDLADLELDYDVGIAYGFGLIFGVEIIERFAHGIWNIHAGKLPQYRSRHPIGWALIENQRELSLSIHTIDGEIDRGHLLGELTLPISIDDNEMTLTARVETIAARELIDMAIDTYQTGSWKEIGKGRYLPSLQGRWDSVDPSEVDSVFLFNLIRSKMRYGGVVIAGKRYSQCDFVYPEMKERYGEGDFYTCNDGIEVRLR